MSTAAVKVALICMFAIVPPIASSFSNSSFLLKKHLHDSKGTSYTSRLAATYEKETRYLDAKRR